MESAKRNNIGPIKSENIKLVKNDNIKLAELAKINIMELGKSDLKPENAKLLNSKLPQYKVSKK